MPKTNCVNPKNPEVLQIAKELELHPQVAASQIGLWQDENGVDNFPTKENLFNTKEIKTLQEAIGIPKKKQLSSKQTILAKARLRKYNDANNTSHRFITKQVGQADLYTWNFIPNYSPKNQQKQLERDRARTDAEDVGRIEDINRKTGQMSMFSLKTVKPEYKGKIIWAAPGTGKSQASGGNVIDGDRILAEVLGVPVKDIHSAMDKITPGRRLVITKAVGQEFKKLAKEGKTVLTPNEAFLPIADLALYTSDPFRMKRDTASSSRENPYEQTIVEAKQRINRYKDRIKKSNTKAQELKPGEYLSHVLFGESPIINKANNDLNRSLVSYLANFGISVQIQDVETFQELFGIDSIGVLGVLNKMIVLDQSFTEPIPLMFSRALVFMMQQHQTLQEIYEGLQKKKS